MSLFLAIFVLSLALVAWWVILKRRWIQDLDKIPGPWKQALPLLGNLFELARLDVHRQFLLWANQYGGVYRVRLLWKDMLVVTDPSVVATICSRGEEALDKASLLYTPINGMTSRRGQHPSLLTSPSDASWQTIRKAVAKAFSFNNIKQKFPFIVERVDALITCLHDLGPNTSVDVDQMALRVTLDIIGLAGFGYSYKSIEQSNPAPKDHLLRVLPRCFTEVMIRFANPLRAWAPWLFFLPQPGVLGWGTRGQMNLGTFQDEMKKLFEAVRQKAAIRKSDGSQEDGPEEDVSMGKELFKLAREGIISEERVLSEFGILFIEGFETTGHTIGWTLFNIATTPGVQDRVEHELDSLGLLVKGQRSYATPSISEKNSSALRHEQRSTSNSSSGTNVSFSEVVHETFSGRQIRLEDLKHLRYLTACIKEAMRMFPVVSVMSRVTKGESTRVGSFNVPAGVSCLIPLYAIQNRVGNGWDAPEEFRPERFTDIPIEAYVAGPETWTKASIPCADKDSAPCYTQGSSRCSINFMPFSEGARNCVGQSLAKLEVVTVVAKILANFRIHLAPEMKGREGVLQRESTLLTLQTKGTLGIRMHLEPRGR